MIDMQAMMANEGARKSIEDVKAKLESDPVIGKLIDAAQSVKDLYEISKNYVEMKWEDFKAICEDALHYFNEDKVALPDDALDMVAGGGWSDFWNKCKSAVIAVGVGVGIAVVVGALTAGAIVSLPIAGAMAAGTIAGGAIGIGSMAGIVGGIVQYFVDPLGIAD